METLTRVHTVALAGNPNVGKTTLFNALTGSFQKVANYPGVTVERKSGLLAGRGDGEAAVEIVDLPGTYSLNPRSVDERVAFDALVGRIKGEPAPDVVVCVVDATNLERNLYLVTQVLDLGLPTVVALNMMDAAEEAGITVDHEALAQTLGVPVLPIVARKAEIDALRAAILNPPKRAEGVGWELMPAVEAEIEPLAEALAQEAASVPEGQRRFEVLGALTSDPLLAAWETKAPQFHATILATRERLEARPVPYKIAEMQGRYGWISPVAARVVTQEAASGEATLSDRIDAVVTHKIWGPLIFGGVLLVIFQAVFSWAVPAMDLIEWLVGVTGEGMRAVLPDGVFEDVMVEGALSGVGNVLIFLPQILLLFFFLGLMEDSGYMARTAFIMDRAMRRVGLSGASVVPMLSAYACAIPGIMAARTLADERDRIITIMVVPLQGCSARLPVYVLFIAAFIPSGALFGIIGYQGLAMTSLYVLGTVMAFFAAWVLRKFVFKGEGSSFVMELPPYRMPQPKHLWRRMRDRAKVFVVRAGKIIFGLSIVLWFLASYPKVDLPPELAAQAEAAEAQVGERFVEVEPDVRAELEETDAASIASAQEAADAELVQDEVAGYQVRNSYIGRFGHAIEPVMRPLGFDWKISAGIVASFAAREVIVSALATIYSAGADANEESLALRDAIKADRYPDGTPVFTPLVAVSLLVFFVFALQCMSTLAIAKRELNSWLWPLAMWGYMFALAYGFSFAIYQGGKLLGLG
ncbi:ferrous iron transport protein B [Rubricoccus marinus]|uniref:Ferrous iron transport protein B n=1 Tax=Rubricoccus marinus TaxID=716817 RepID=A0A259U0X7_9BACT|nr:ferrous iron transport protein B [Rubricoccus marinus]OZC03652.1 ferrous iron transport protein B [Rubricoccus marinus]